MNLQQSYLYLFLDSLPLYQNKTNYAIANINTTYILASVYCKVPTKTFVQLANIEGKINNFNIL